MIVSYKELGFHMSRGRTKPYFVLRHATSCVTTHDSYFQLPELPSTVSSGGLLAEKEPEVGCTGRLRPASEECGTPEKRRSELSHRATAGTARLLRH